MEPEKLGKEGQEERVQKSPADPDSDKEQIFMKRIGEISMRKDPKDREDVAEGRPGQKGEKGDREIVEPHGFHKKEEQEKIEGEGEEARKNRSKKLAADGGGLSFKKVYGISPPFRPS